MGNERKVRKGQVISPFGPGGVFDFGDESFIALDISEWKLRASETIRDIPRLRQELSVLELREPVVASENTWEETNYAKSVPYMRFPAWLFCPRCRRMRQWSWKDERPGKPPLCTHCGSKARLAPMRFIAVCENGHIADLDWVRWAHIGAGSEEQKKCTHREIEFLSDPRKGGGLASLSIRCRSCKSSNPLTHIAQKDALKHNGLGRCSGRHPWQHHENAVNCDRVPQVVQRGASNAYFPVTLTALDIQSDAEKFRDSWTDSLERHPRYQFLSQLWEMLSDPKNAALQQLVSEIAEDIGESTDKIFGHLQGESEDDNEGGIEEDNSVSPDLRLKAEEWDVFTTRDRIQSDVFSAERVDLNAFGLTLSAEEQLCWAMLRKLIDRIVLARRIRIVRAFRGFRRLDPGGKIMGANLLTPRPEWLPAIETYGEGIFLSLSNEELQTWERKVGRSATESICNRQMQSGLGQSLPDASPRYVLLHTLSHLLIRQLCFECGYSSSSLAERIYCSDDMAGILIYTASGDSEGALGGLVREGEPDRFYGIMKTALYRGRWCSNDPICSELPFQGYGGMNRAACHACTLLGETSCETANSLLDRTLIYGKEGLTGYFEAFTHAMEVGA
ncbi:DrmB family protein [Shewanella algae]